ncbi:MAG TPA: glutathione S-transferase family protein [Polyangiales bacterium]
MTIKIYHSRRARSARVIWLLEELGVPYELETLEFKPEVLHAPAFLQVHPLGQLPALRDDDVTMFESGAIVQYLLEKYGAGRLQPQPGSAASAIYLQWFHYGEASLASHMSEIVRQRFIQAPTAASEAILALARTRFREALAVIDRALEGREYIAGDSFSAADLMIVYPIVMARITRELPDEFKNVAAYFERLKQRPAYAIAWA